MNDILSVVSDIRAVLRKRENTAGPFIICIGGNSCVGKTTFARLLSGLLEESCIINTDAYLNEVHKKHHDTQTAAHPASVDKELLQEHLRLIRKNKSFPVPSCEVNKEVGLFIQTYKPCKAVIVEGIASMVPLFMQQYDFRIIIRCSPSLQKSRILSRDTTKRSRKMESIRSRLSLRNKQYKEYLKPLEVHADLIVESLENEKFSIVRYVPINQ